LLNLARTIGENYVFEQLVPASVLRIPANHNSSATRESRQGTLDNDASLRGSIPRVLGRLRCDMKSTPEEAMMGSFTSKSLIPMYHDGEDEASRTRANAPWQTWKSLGKVIEQSEDM
jgi:hypothetical protein